MFQTIAILLIVATCATATPIHNCTIFYVAVAGDTCATLANYTVQSIADVIAVNPGINCSAPLVAGASYCYTNEFGPFPCSGYYTVKSTDTCQSLWAMSYFMSAAVFFELNSGFDCSKIKAGQQVCTGVMVYTNAPSTQITTPIVPLSVMPCTMWYVAIDGDTCYTVGGSTGVSIATFEALNPGVTCSMSPPAFLVTGKSYCFANTWGPYPCTEYYTVTASDDCNTLYWSQYFNSPASFYRLNSGFNCTALHVGQKICVAAANSTTTTNSTTNATTVAPTTTAKLTTAPTTTAKLTAAPTTNTTTNATAAKATTVILTTAAPTTTAKLTAAPTTNTTTNATTPATTTTTKATAAAPTTTAQATTAKATTAPASTNATTTKSANTTNAGPTTTKHTQPPLQPTNCTFWYVAVPGDTCSSAATLVGLTLAQFEQMNPNWNCNHTLIAGTNYCFANYPPFICASYYTVKATDTCGTLWAMSAFKWSAVFFELNSGFNCAHIKAGQQVCTAVQQVSAAPTTTARSG